MNKDATWKNENQDKSIHPHFSGQTFQASECSNLADETINTINVKGKLLDVSFPRVMGVINITPDSFYQGSRYTDEKSILKQVEKMLEEGATFIDVGGYSSRPGADDIPVEEEKRRTIEAIALINKNFPEAIISIDTFRASVAREGVESGAAIVNDISGGNLDENMMDTMATLQVPYIMMHMKGTPQNMQQQTKYNDLIDDIVDYFQEKIFHLRKLGLKDLIIDPGFGFAKTIDQNYSLLHRLQELKMFGLPVLAGLSRKSMIYKKLNISAGQALNGTTVLNTIALMQGANILRVHDVKEAVEAIQILNWTFH